MEEDLLAALTEGQKDCLRLVLSHNSSKEIAQALGVSPHTVDQRIKVAMRTLAAPNRVEAARTLYELERPRGYQGLVYQAPDIAASRFGGAGRPPNDGKRADGDVVREEQVAYDPALSRRGGGMRWPFATPAHRRNDLDVWQRLGWIVAIAVATILAFGTLVSSLTALGGLVLNTAH